MVKTAVSQTFSLQISPQAVRMRVLTDLCFSGFEGEDYKKRASKF